MEKPDSILQSRRAGTSSFSDYDILKNIICLITSHSNSEKIADNLLNTFGDLNHVLSASPRRLEEARGVNRRVIALLKLIEATGHRMARAKIIDRPILDNWTSLLEYLYSTSSHLDTERLRVFYLDRKNVLILDEEFSRGTVDHVPVYPREVIKRALMLNASAIIISHNHTSGDPSPSKSDIAMTYSVRDAADALEIILHDHIIIGKGCEFSFRSSGLL